MNNALSREKDFFVFIANKLLQRHRMVGKITMEDETTGFEFYYNFYLILQTPTSPNKVVLLFMQFYSMNFLVIDQAIISTGMTQLH